MISNWLDWSQQVSFCEHSDEGDEPPRFIRSWECFDRQNNWQLL
jgi:hypothetical protein